MFISLDLETTGINPDKDKIIEFGAVKFDLKGNTETLQTLIHPGITLPEIITHITGITDEDLKNAPPFQEKAEEISAFIGDLPIIGHNIQFDTSFLRNHHIELKNPEYDTVQLASILFPGLNSYSLEILTHLLDLKHKDKHRALDDAVAAMELFLKLKDKFQELDPDLIKKIHSLCEKTQWPTAKFLKTLPPTKSKTHILPPLTALPKSPLPENYKELLNTKKSQLFQISPPYYSLIQSLAKDAHKDTYISVPHMLFHDLTPTLPDSITKIDSPKKYISQRRLSEFENKKFFEDYEFTGLIKTLVWLKQTKTGLLPEIIFFNQEKQIILHINADKDFTELKDEPFVQKAMEKDKTSPAICSHQYLIDQKPEIKDLILIDLDKFTKSIFYEQ
ncbi:MAG: exonuclease domain-containing protein, partial [Candidatus Peregrinibacteria bacterium]